MYLCILKLLQIFFLFSMVIITKYNLEPSISFTVIYPSKKLCLVQRRQECYHTHKELTLDRNQRTGKTEKPEQSRVNTVYTIFWLQLKIFIKFEISPFYKKNLIYHPLSIPLPLYLARGCGGSERDRSLLEDALGGRSCTLFSLSDSPDG